MYKSPGCEALVVIELSGWVLWWKKVVKEGKSGVRYCIG